MFFFFLLRFKGLLSRLLPCPVCVLCAAFRCTALLLRPFAPPRHSLACQLGGGSAFRASIPSRHSGLDPESWVALCAVLRCTIASPVSIPVNAPQGPVSAHGMTALLRRCAIALPLHCRAFFSPVIRLRANWAAVRQPVQARLRSPCTNCPASERESWVALCVVLRCAIASPVSILAFASQGPVSAHGMTALLRRCAIALPLHCHLFLSSPVIPASERESWVALCVVLRCAIASPVSILAFASQGPVSEHGVTALLRRCTIRSLCTATYSFLPCHSRLRAGILGSLMRGIALRYCLAGVHPRQRLSGSRIKCGMTAQARRLCCFAAVAAIATACASLLVSLMRQLGCGSAAGMTAERKTRGKGLPYTQKPPETMWLPAE